MIPLVACVALLGCGCGSGSSGPPSSDDRSGAPIAASVSAPKRDPAAPPPPAPTVPARIFVDTSGSMAGFFGPRDGGRTLAAVHEELDAALAEAGMKSTKKCTVGDKVRCEGVPAAPAKLAARALYREATSRLDQVLSRAPAPARIDPNQPPAPDLLDDASVTLLVTDGMAVAPGGGAAASCAGGADPTCVGQLLQRRIDEGFGVWLVGLRLPFDGTHFPERTLTAAYFAQARAHVEQLRFDPRNLGVTFAIPGQLGTDGTSGGKSTYRYQGYKPLVLFVLSRDAALGRALADAIVKKLRAAPIQPGKMRPDETVQGVELAPLAATPTRAASVAQVPADEQRRIFGKTFDPARLAELKLEASARFGDGISLKIWCGANGRSMLDLRYEQTGGRTLPPYFKEQVVLVPAGTAPKGAVAAPAPAGADRIRTGVSCEGVPVGPDTELGFTLETHLALDEAELATQWWSRAHWSSEDAWQMPERVYRLEDIILPILKQRAGRRIRWGRVAIHVKRV